MLIYCDTLITDIVETDVICDFKSKYTLKHLDALEEATNSCWAGRLNLLGVVSDIILSHQR